MVINTTEQASDLPPRGVPGEPPGDTGIAVDTDASFASPPDSCLLQDRLSADGPGEAEDEISFTSDADHREAARTAWRLALEANTVLLYEPEALARIIRGLEGREEPDEFDDPDAAICDPDHDPSADERHRLAQLRRLARHRLGPRRRLLLGSPEMLAQVEAIAAEAPHFGPLLALVARAVALSITTATPLRVPPVLLVGEPGIGKTYTLKRLAAALGSASEFLPCNMLDSWRLRGLNTAWRGAKIGRIAEVLLASPTVSPVIVLDEFEKAPVLGTHDRPYDIFHSLLEEENARTFVDDYLELPLRADHVIWIAAANGTTGLPSSILDRMLVIEAAAPTRDQLMTIVDAIYAAARARHGGHFATALGGEVRDLLARHNPRRLKRVLALALGYAAAAGRDMLIADDVACAIALAAGGPHGEGFRHPVGFAP